MIFEIKKWCEGIIVAVILCIIIESLIPNGNNKKYIKVVIGIYIMYVTLNPILSLLNYEFDFEMFDKFGEFEEVSNPLDNNIKDVYILGIEQNIQSELENLGYNVEYVNVFVDLNYENIQKIELKINNDKQTNENLITEPITINNNKNKIISNTEIVDYINQNYFVNKENIIFK